MMRPLLFLLALTTAAISPRLSAQQPGEVPPPTAPFVLPPPERSAWTIKVTRPEVTRPEQPEGAKKEHAVTAIESLHYGESKRDLIFYSDSTKVEIWYVGQYELVASPNGSRVGVRPAEQEGIANEPVSAPRFPGLDWLSASSYQGVAKIGEQQCRHYVKGGEGDRWEAWIGLESQLPVAAKFGAVAHSYSFTTPPAAPPQMPAMYAQALEDLKKQAARAAALAEKFRRR